MAEQKKEEAKKPEQKKEEKAVSTVCFKSEQFSQLSVVVDGEVRDRFQGFVERFAGEDRKVGYLETSDKDVIRILADDINVEEISASEFKNSTDASKKGVRPLPSIVF